MTIDIDEARIARLRAMRNRLEAQLADPATPPYSIAPLSNQLRLVDKDIDRLLRQEAEADDGLPTTPDQAGFVNFLQYGYQCRHPAAFKEARRSTTAWGIRLNKIYDSWQAAGFVLPPRPARDDIGQPHRAALERWTDECRAELARCLRARTFGRTEPDD